jgi:DNA-binding transcriptional MerR regulator
MSAQFDDGKEEGALRTIGEVSSALGIKTHVLRYWEAQFPMLDPLKRSGGRRYYRPDDVALVQEIDRLVNREGYTLKGANAALKDFRGATGENAVRAEPDATPAQRTAARAPEVRPDLVERLKSIRATLASAL